MSHPVGAPRFARRPAGRLELACLLTILAAGAFLRLYNLTSLPAGLHGDEAIAGLLGQRVLREGSIGPYTLAAAGGPTGLYYLTAPSVWAFGNTILAVRLVTALAGIATVLALYVVLRRNLGVAEALLGAGLLAVLGWHIHFARAAFPAEIWPLAVLLATGALLEAVRCRSWRWWALAGGLGGAGIYAYNAQVLSLAITGLFLGLFVALDRSLPPRRPLAELAAFALALGLVALPMVAYARDPAGGLPKQFQGRLITETAEWQSLTGAGDRLGFLAERYSHFWDRLCCHPEVDTVDGTGATAVVPLSTLVLVALGAALGLARRRGPLVYLGLLLVLVAPLGAVITEGAPIRRSFVIAPFLALFAALAAVEVPRCARSLGRAGRLAASLGLAAIMGLATFQNLDDYFVRFAGSPQQRWVFAADFTDAARYMATLPPASYVYFYSDRWSINYETRQFLAPGVRGEDRSREFGTPGFDLRRQEGRPVFLFVGAYTPMVEEVVRRYPRGILTIGGPADRPSFIAYTLPADAEVSGATTRDR